MSTLADIEQSIPELTIEELAKLENFIRQTKRERLSQPTGSVFDLEPIHLGTMLRPLGGREEWYDEMLEGRV